MALDKTINLPIQSQSSKLPKSTEFTTSLTAPEAMKSYALEQMLSEALSSKPTTLFYGNSAAYPTPLFP